MKHDEKWGQELIWASVGLLGLSCLLLHVSFSPDMFGYKVIWYVVEISLIVIEVSLVYLLVRKFFGKKKQ